MNEDTKEEQKIRDPEEIANTERLKGIFNVREQIHQARLHVQSAKQSKYKSNYQAACRYRTLTESYIMETEPLLRRYEPGPKLLNEKHFGTVVLVPRTKNVRFGTREAVAKVESEESGPGSNYVGITEEPEPAEWPMVGLLSLIETADPITEQWVLDCTKIGTDTVTCTPTSQVNFRILDKMVRSINEFLAEIGFEVGPEEEQDVLKL